MIKKHVAIIALGIWLLLMFFFMIWTQNVDITVFFVFGFIGFLIVLKIVEPKFVHPAYMQYFWYFVIAGIGIVAVIAFSNTLKNLT
jgi:hypothetical protein